MEIYYSLSYGPTTLTFVADNIVQDQWNDLFYHKMESVIAKVLRMFGGDYIHSGMVVGDSFFILFHQSLIRTLKFVPLVSSSIS